MGSHFTSRIRIFSLVIFLFALILISKLAFLQIVHGSSFEERANSQYATPSTNIFNRGSIFFTTKDGVLVSAATITSGFRVAINPGDITASLSVYEQLASIISLDKDSFLKKAEKKDDPYEEVANKITKIEADQISELELSGVSIYREKWRFYPGATLAAHTLGFIAYRGDDLGGRYGLERYYNDVLRREVSELYINPFAEIFSNINTLIFKDKQKEGDIITSIEPTVQGFLENTIKGIMDDWQADSAGGIIIDPIDGSLYAMVHLPSFDLNNFRKVKDPLLFSNPLVENVFEFGSIIKPLTMAAGLDAGVVTRDTKYEDKGFVIVNNRTIHNFDKKGRGVVSMQDVLTQSLNTGAVFVMKKLGRDVFRDYMLAYGIGEKTGIDLPNETSGLVGNLKSNKDIEYATASFGQGIAITPVGAVRAFSVLANGGKLITPHIAQKIDYKEGGTREVDYSLQKEQIIKKETSEEITRMLVTIVDKSIAAKATNLEHYSIAAKTGTAQIAKVKERGYYDDRFLHSFFGYFPAYNPKFLVLFYIVNPKGVRYAQQTLANPFIDTAKFLLNYYEIPPDR